MRDLRVQEFLRELVIDVAAPSVLVGTSEGLVGPRVLEGAHCRCCDTE